MQRNRPDMGIAHPKGCFKTALSLEANKRLSQRVTMSKLVLFKLGWCCHTISKLFWGVSTPMAKCTSQSMCHSLEAKRRLSQCLFVQIGVVSPDYLQTFLSLNTNGKIYFAIHVHSIFDSCNLVFFTW